MIALQHERSLRLLIQPVSRTRRTRRFDVFVNDLAVVNHLHKARVLSFLPGRVESRSTKNNIK